MKTFKKISAIMMMAMVLIFTVGCKKEKSSNNETVDYSKQIVGNWYYGAENQTHNSILMLNEDKSMICIGSNESGVYQYNGTYSIDKENLTLTVDNVDSRTVKVEFSGENLIIHHENNTHSYVKLNENIDLVGKWNLSSADCSIVPIKEYIEIPSELSIGEETLEPIPTAEITSQMINHAVHNALLNLEFTDTHIKYNAVSGDNILDYTKEYSLNNLQMTVKGDFLGLEVDVPMYAIEEKDKNQTILVLDKNALSIMFFGFATINNVDTNNDEIEPEVLEEFRQNFADAFSNFTAIICIKKQ